MLVVSLVEMHLLVFMCFLVGFLNLNIGLQKPTNHIVGKQSTDNFKELTNKDGPDGMSCRASSWSTGELTLEALKNTVYQNLDQDLFIPFQQTTENQDLLMGRLMCARPGPDFRIFQRSRTKVETYLF